jgi:hypothetical protein
MIMEGLLFLLLLVVGFNNAFAQIDPGVREANRVILIFNALSAGQKQDILDFLRSL